MSMKNTQEEIKEIREELNQVKALVQIAKVSAVYSSRRTARVVWPDGNSSPELRVIRQSEAWMPSIGQYVLCLRRKDGGGFILGVI